jgi:hypothetical protein
MTQPGQPESSRRATVKLELELGELGMERFKLELDSDSAKTEKRQ